MTRPRVGISSCLLGQHVRYDGGHKLLPFAAGPLADLVTLVPVCPEVELGMGVPREPVRLERSRGIVRMVGIESRTDHTDAMTAFAARRTDELAALGLAGYVFKKNSPSCGPRGVPVGGRGLFAAAVGDRMPLLPVVDESDISDREGRKTFLRKVFAYERLRKFFAGRWSREDLAKFHSLHRRRSPGLAAVMRRLKSTPPDQLAERYQRAYMETIRKPVRASKPRPGERPRRRTRETKRG
jgi:uncharacterized protein YbbK (DUF523 family)